MKRLLLCLAALCLLMAPALAEAPAASLTIAVVDESAQTPPLHVDDESFLRWLEPLLTADGPAVEPAPLMPAHHRLLVTFTAEDGSQAEYALWHDTLYEEATVTHPDGTTRAIDPAVPALLFDAVHDEASFAVPEAHRALLAESGWTAVYRVPQQSASLPEALEASRTDAAALYFTYADLFLQGGGYDITPFLGKTVTPHVYRVYERVNRIVWRPQDIRLLDENGEGGVMYDMQAVLLECGGQLIGAYLRAVSWDAADMMSLDRRGPIELLGDMSIRDYLLSKLPVTQEEEAMAALTAEEVVRQYASVHDPRLTAIERVLATLSPLGTDSLFLPIEVRSSGETPLSVQPVDTAPGFYEVRLGDWTYYPEVALESPQTGWKIMSFYNTGL